MCFTFLSRNIVVWKGSNIYNTIVEIHETELIDGLRSGESKAYRTLFDNYYHLLFRIACQYVRDDTVADTIVGDVLSHIWETRASLNITSSLQAYLVCCVRNYALNYQKKIFADREISIDDYEMDNLLKLSEEVFGLDNFESCIAWRRRTNQPNDKSKMIAKVSESIIVFAKNGKFLSEKKAFHGIPLSEERCKEYKNPDNDPCGAWSTNPWKAAVGRGGTRYTITTPTGISFTETWYGNEETFKSLVSKNRVYWTDNGNGFPRIKIYLSDAKRDGQAAINFFTPERFGSNQEGSSELEQLFGHKGIFDNPKPTKLIRSLVQMASNDDSIVLDFFSGTATTAHAVMQLNAEDGGHRKFIMVQLPEKTDEKSEAYKAGYKNICEIGKERIRRAGKKIKEDAGLTAPADLDIGFRCLRLDESNMKPVYYTPEEISQQDLFSLVDNVKEDRTPEDLLFQVMLDLGVLLSSPIEVKEIAGKKVFNVADGFLLACFDHDVTEETVKAIAQMKPYYAVFRDSSMANDSVATNFDQIFETYSPETVRKVL